MFYKFEGSYEIMFEKFEFYQCYVINCKCTCNLVLKIQVQVFKSLIIASGE